MENMKILFLQLSDIHIHKKQDGFDINIDKIVNALNELGTVDQCIIILSGDITKTGSANEFKIAGNMLGNLITTLKDKKFKGKYINILAVPGNHDLDFNNNKRTFEDIIQSHKKRTINKFINNDIKSLENFYKFSRRNKCFTDDNIVSHKSIKIDDKIINFTLINTAIFSLCGSTNEDMGIHYLNDENISNLPPKSKGNLNIVIMHHSCEWFATNVKEKLRDNLNENFSLIFEGHEHDSFGENRKTNNKNSTVYIQGNTLSGDKDHKRGFTTVVYDTNYNSVKGASFVWNTDYYKYTQILDTTIEAKKGYPFVNTENFIQNLKYDDNQKLIDQYFVFPTLKSNIRNKNDELETCIITDSAEFIKTIRNNTKTIISGDNRSGKSTLAKFIYKFFINSKNGIVPLMLLSEDLKNKKIDKIVKYAFNDQYKENNNAYDKFLQLDKEKKLLIIDDADKIEKPTLDKILKYYNKANLFNNIILFSEEQLELNIEKQIIETLTEEKIGQINIRPFLYDKRKILISKVYDSYHSPEINKDKNKAINDLNNIISSQVKYFKLNPEFIVNFVLQYTENFKFNFSTENNVFNMIYENSIKNRIINNSNPSDVNGIFNIMGELAYYMHFNKKSWIITSDLLKIIETYNKDFRQNVALSTFLDVGKRARLITENGSEIQFKDKNLLSYFVAQALNKKSHYENVNNKLEYILNNLCFGINSDIILFIALITNNPSIISLILNCAHNHFDGMQELSFDNNNIPFLCNSQLNVKNTVPDKEEKKEKEKELVKYEEDMYYDEVVELVDEYNYSEDDITIPQNQKLKSIKYLEILSKILPDFCHNMKAEQQDEFVQALYHYTNCFLYQCLKDISDDYNNFAYNIFNKITNIRKEKNIAELNIDKVLTTIEQMSAILLVSFYNLIASTSTTNQTIAALNAFDYNNNSNYKILNLMMTEKSGDLREFTKKAISLNNKSTLKLMKSMIKFTVRNYFLDNEIKIVGEAQSLMDTFFGSSDTFNDNKKNIKNEMVKNRLNSH